MWNSEGAMEQARDVRRDHVEFGGLISACSSFVLFDEVLGL